LLSLKRTIMLKGGLAGKVILGVTLSRRSIEVQEIGMR
jgi:hypothetical protein